MTSSACADKHWDLNLTFEVPLPATLPLLLVGLAGLFLGTRRRMQG
ncbi:MAG: PEP-CTERM sorting domain-containing protein [Halofilum sp. (in: g-proteobacteria)]|nr:PEP-CTERM sorting domain-containing protein [Halofilum sp. (in: g-proteobacteria)]